MPRDGGIGRYIGWAGFVVLTVCLLAGCSSGPDEADEIEPIVTFGGAEGETPTGSRTDEPCTVVPPGGNRTFRLEFLAPFLHSTEDYTRLDLEYALAEPAWARYNVAVGLNHYSLSAEEAEVWTHVVDGWPVVVDLSGRSVRDAGYWVKIGREAHSTTGDVLVRTDRPAEFQAQGRLPWSEIVKVWKYDEKEARDPRFRIDETRFSTRRYAFYRVAVVFTVGVPADEEILETIWKESHYKQTDLVFWPRRVMFGADEWTMETSGPKTTVTMSLSRKPQGWRGVSLQSGRAELTCE